MNEIEQILAQQIGSMVIDLARAQAGAAKKDAQIQELEKALSALGEKTDGKA
ncbi:hypothetical protein [Sphingobium limneticum]|uniref:hypothetical protein n=1 Tax=Sphingobium limneticum TaxID=1007511 RepID=UPI00137551A1|nr:hypothetical protein [Sphingobium limneticum]